MPILNELGNLGVKIFFVISGYVITAGLINEDRNSGRISLIGFYARRAFRILPPLIMYVTAVFILAREGFLPAAALGVGRALTFTCNFADCGGWFGGHTWSLSYEEQFYLFIPVLFSLVWGSMSYVLLLMPVAIIAIIFFLYPIDQNAALFFAYFLAIAIGVAWAATETFILKIFSSAPRSLLFLSPVLLVMAERGSDTRFWPIGAMLTPIIITFILVRSGFVDRALAEKLSTPWLTRLGRISYSVYLWQQLATFSFPGVGAIFYIFSISGCLVWAFVSYVFIEKPLISLGRTLCRSRAPAEGRGR